MGSEGITAVKTSARRTLEIGKKTQFGVWLLCLVLWELEICVCWCVRHRQREWECVYECCCSTDATSMFLSFTLQTLKCPLLCKLLLWSRFIGWIPRCYSLCLCVRCIMMYCSELKEHCYFNRKSTISHFNCFASHLLSFRHTYTDLTNLLKSAFTSQMNLLLLRLAADWVWCFMSGSDGNHQLFPAHIVLLGPSSTLLINKTALLCMCAHLWR